MPNTDDNPRSFRRIFSAGALDTPKLTFGVFLDRARHNLKTRRGVFLFCAKADNTRVPLYRTDEGGKVVWPTTWREFRENLRSAEPAALTEVDPHAVWSVSDILRVGETVWNEFERERMNPAEREADDARLRANKRAKELRRERKAAKRAAEKEARRLNPKRSAIRVTPIPPGLARQRAEAARRHDVEEWARIGAPHLDDVLPLRLVARRRKDIAEFGSGALVRRTQITAGEFMRHCVGLKDVPLKGWSIYAGQALDRIPEWERVGKKRHYGTVAVVWRRKSAIHYGTCSEFELVEPTIEEPAIEAPAAVITKRRRVL